MNPVCNEEKNRQVIEAERVIYRKEKGFSFEKEKNCDTRKFEEAQLDSKLEANKEPQEQKHNFQKGKWKISLEIQEKQQNTYFS
ncbi:hypothetical protein O181_107598, partial [Austropuccinia psidii MF-1]|nr:hypothetical protein [Austropuccinia psidii MF-1]